MSNKNPVIQGSKHFDMVFLVPPLFRLRDSTHFHLLPTVASVISRNVDKAKYSSNFLPRCSSHAPEDCCSPLREPKSKKWTKSSFWLYNSKTHSQTLQDSCFQSKVFSLLLPKNKCFLDTKETIILSVNDTPWSDWKQARDVLCLY